MLTKLSSLAQQLDEYIHGRLSGKVPTNYFVFTLRHLFPHKSAKEFALLAKGKQTMIILYQQIMDYMKSYVHKISFTMSMDTHVDHPSSTI